MELSLTSLNGKVKEKVKVSDDVFSVKPNNEVVHSALVWYLRSRRQGTHSAMTRSEVAGSGKKPWKQKGTGRARAGSATSPLWKGGGVAFPPKPRDYSFSMPKKARKLALRVVLSDKARGGNVRVVEEFKAASPKTKEMAAMLKSMGVSGKTMIISDLSDRNAVLSVRNLRGVKLSRPSEINVHDLLWSDCVIVDRGSVKALEEVLR